MRPPDRRQRSSRNRPAAIAARRQALHLKTLVIDPAKFPRDKTCGDGLGPGVVARLEELDVGNLLNHARPIEALGIVGPSGESVSGALATVGQSIDLPVGEGTSLSWRPWQRCFFKGIRIYEGKRPTKCASV